MNHKRRFWLRIGITLLLGMACTVGAAWLSAMTIDPALAGATLDVESTKTITHSVEVTRSQRFSVVMFHATHAKGQFDQRSIELFGGGHPDRIVPRWCDLAVPSRVLEKAHWSEGDRVIIENRTVVARGWPLPALWSQVKFIVTQGDTVLALSRSDGGIATAQRAWNFPWNRTLPLRVAPLGFLVDTLFYTFLVGALVFGLPLARNLMRLRN